MKMKPKKIVHDICAQCLRALHICSCEWQCPVCGAEVPLVEYVSHFLIHPDITRAGLPTPGVDSGVLEQ
jgi:hypothetical protein